MEVISDKTDNEMHDVEIENEPKEEETKSSELPDDVQQKAKLEEPVKVV